jgi:GMP synthase-like glutamine amidotransferase
MREAVKPLVILQHEVDAPPGSIAVALRDLGMPFEVRHVYRGDPLPVWPEETSGLIALGGSMQVSETRKYPFLEAEKTLMRRLVMRCGPVWGICLGAELLTLAAGGQVYRRDRPEIGWIQVEKVRDDPLLHGVGSPFTAFNWHEYSCTLPPRAELVAERAESVQVFRTGGRSWATQFHPELDDEIAPHWVRDAAAQHEKKLGAEFVERLQADTERLLPSYPAFCARLTENFLRAADLHPNGG